VRNGYPRRVHHDPFIRHVVGVISSADQAAIERAWLASLVSRDQLRRSVWPRLIFLRHLPEHPFTPSRHFSATTCGACGIGEEVDPVTPDELADDRFWFRPISVPWATAAIEQFVADDGVELVDQGRTVLAGILSAIRSLPPSAQLTELNASLIGRVKSNKMERTILLEALGYAGVLPVAGHPSYADEFISYDDAHSRQPAQHYKKEWAYPIRFWTGADGVTEPALTFGSK